MRKKGAINLEIIIAATIFIFSVALIIYYINFSMKSEIQDPFLDILESGIRKEAEINFNTILLHLADNSACFNVSLHSDITQDQENLLILEDKELVAFNLDNGLLLINNTDTSKDNHTYYIYEFPKNITNNIRFEAELCNSLIKGADYNYSISYQDKIFTNKTLSDLKSNYTINYNGLKSDFGIDNRDFEIIIKNETKQLFNMTRKKPAQPREVRAKELPIKIIYENGNIMDALMNMRIW